MRHILQQTQQQSYHIAPKNTLENQHHTLRQKDITNELVRRTQRLQNTNPLHTVQNHNNQTRNDVETRHTQHQNDDNHHIHIQQIKPRENLRIKLLNRLRIISIIILVKPIGRRKIHIIRHLLQPIKIVHHHIDSRTLIVTPQV